jgi:lactoylglutathione lyase
MPRQKMLGAVGLGVSDMAKSVAFYKEQLGMAPLQYFDVEAFTETVMGWTHKGAGSQIILMQYKNVAPPRNQQGKLVFYIDDVPGMIKKLKAYGCKVYLEPGKAEQAWAKQIGMVRDPDGFLLEFIPLSMLSRSSDFGSKL